MAHKKVQRAAAQKPCDLINLGVIAKAFPRQAVDSVLQQTGKESVRKRDLPNHVIVYYVIALALYMQQSSREVLRILLEALRLIMAQKHQDVHIAGKSGISQARTRVGYEPLKQLYEAIVTPVAVKTASRRSRGAWYRDWHVVSLDGSTLDVADTQKNEQEFGRCKSSRGTSAFPQIRFVALLENGTHVFFASTMGGYYDDEINMARQLLPRLGTGMLCLADRYFFGYDLWCAAKATGADLLWRVKTCITLPCHKRLKDGSYLSKIYPSYTDRLRDRNGTVVRVIDYCLPNQMAGEPFYRLVTTILDPDEAPAQELAALYHERWEIETALDEFKTHLRGARIVLRSKCPDLVRQEFYGFMLAHFAVRGLMHEAALAADIDADTLSFVHSIRVIRRKMATFSAFSPSPATEATPCGAC